MAQGFDQQDKTPNDTHHTSDLQVGSGSGCGPGDKAPGPDEAKPGSSEFDLDLGELGEPQQPATKPAGGGAKKSSVLKLAGDAGAPASQSGGQKKKSSGVLKLAGEDDLPPSGNLETEELNEGELAGGLQPTVGLENVDLAPPVKKTGGSDVRLDLETGSFEFDLKVDSSGRLNAADDPAPKSAPPAPPSAKKTVTPPAATPTQVADDEVILDFDSSTLDDSMLLVGGSGLKPDSDVRIEPVSMSKPPSGVGGAAAPDDMMRTEEIDLDAELQKAAEASLKRKSTSTPKSKVIPEPKPAKTQLPGPKVQTQLPPATTSPFELTEEDLQLPTGSRRSATGSSRPGGGSAPGLGSGSEFELTLAPEDESGSPLALGDDEDIDLGGAPKSDSPSSNRAELSGINLGRPADSGVSLEKGSPSSSDKIDFELTLDDDATGPKTIRGKISDSDSEFELTVDDSGPLTAKPEDIAAAAAGDQKDIFETDFDVPSVEEESGSQAVALDDTDLESSDFDLALEDSSTKVGEDESASQVQALDEESTDAAPRKKKSRVSQVSSDMEIGDVDSMFDEDLMAPEPEPEPAADDEELEPVTVPAAQTDWGIWPVVLMAPCVLVMIMAGLMAYELLHGMWGYHSPSSPGGFLVKELSQLFTGDQSKE